MTMFSSLCMCLSRSCLASSRRLHQSQNLTSLRMTVRLQLQSSGKKVWTLQWITQEVVMTQQPITVQQERAMSVGNSRCLRDTKIPANSLVDKPDLTTKMPGINSLLLNCNLQYTPFCCCFKDKGNHFFALVVADISLDIISTATVWTGICGDSYTVSIRPVNSGATIRTRPQLEGWRPKTSRKQDRARGLRSNPTNRW